MDSLELREVKEVQAKCLVPANRECIKTDLATCIQEREGVRIEVRARGAERDTDELKSEHLYMYKSYQWKTSSQDLETLPLDLPQTSHESCVSTHVWMCVWVCTVSDPTVPFTHATLLLTLSYSKNSSLSSCEQFLPMGQTLIKPLRNSMKVPLCGCVECEGVWSVRVCGV